MARFLAQCIPGMQGVVAEQLAKEPFGPVRLAALEQGFLVFDASCAPSDLRGLRYLNNCFAVLKELPLRPAEGVDDALRRLLGTRDWRPAAGRSVAKHERSFRLVLSDENRLVSADKGVLHQAITVVKGATGLSHRPQGADAEFWVIRRRSGKAFFCKRLTGRARKESDLQRGELRPELAYLLCLISEPGPDDVFLDPFAGSGAIPIARTHFPYNMIFAFDKDAGRVKELRRALRNKARVKIPKDSPFIVRTEDARNLQSIDDGFVDAVVTDPPWGFFDREGDYSISFYRAVMLELVRVTKPGGRIVLLLGSERVADLLITEFQDRLACDLRLNILVSGKKAVVAKCRK